MYHARCLKPVALFVIGLLLSAIASAQDVERMDEVIESYVPDRFMGNVLVAREGEPILNNSYGFANLEWDIPHTAATKFRLGSLTKQFTAAAILLLEEQGKLDTDDPVSVHMANTPAAWEAITIHHLLTHTAGLPNFTSLPGYAAGMAIAATPEKSIAAFKDLPLDFEPGSQFRYSNSGYLVLGHLVELISGGSYAGFLDENIFTPLGMADTGYDSNAEILESRASGYAVGPNGPRNALYIDMTVPHGAGALYSTTGDLLRWNQALFGGELLTSASLQKMLTPNLGDYAYGVIVTETDGRRKISHGGAINGFNTSMAWYPDEELLIVALSNVSGPAADTIGTNLDKILHGETLVLPSERQEVSLSEDVLAGYVGSYPLAPNFVITMTLENGQLMTQATGQQKIPLYAESETRFFLKVVDATVDFQKDASGIVTGLVLTQNGRSTPAPKQ